ncbi:ABC transporter substrate-binding protein [Treponema sp. TIM-1]|uniref:ABC transporter substrate-binding protein n=1 Tax=Treponema sp. TIM-1 TaxID=2898417 RepID=UPI0039805474
MKSRIFLFGIMLSFSVFVLLSCSEKKDAAASTAPAVQESATETPFVVRIGGDSGAFSYQFRVAQKTGIFDKYNIKAEVSTFSYGIDTINAAILGETDSAEAMDFAAASRFSESNKLRIIATISSGLASGSHLYTRHSEVNSPADLRGKRIGVQKATANEYTWARLFDKYGINKEDVIHIYLGSNAELLAAYQANEIDAFWVGADIEKNIQEIPGSRNLGDNSLSGYLSVGFLLLDADIIAKNPAGVERFLKSLDEATVYIKDHPDETARIAYEDLKIPVDAALKTIENHRYQLRLLKEDVDQIADVANWSYENGLFRNKYNIYDFVDSGPLRNILPDRVTVQ